MKDLMVGAVTGSLETKTYPTVTGKAPVRVDSLVMRVAHLH